MDREEFRNRVQSMWDSGTKVVQVVLHDPSTDETWVRNMRLFMSTSKRLCYKDKGRRNYGYEIMSMGYGYNIVSMRDVTPKQKAQDEIGRYVADVAKFKKMFLEKAHGNLWSNIVYNYAKLDVADLERYLRENVSIQSHYDCYKAFLAYAQSKNIVNLIWENRYKTTTIKSHDPKKYRGGNSEWSYHAALDNIQSHLDNKENFEYNWRADYDVTVSGKTGDDGVYRAWLALEFKNMGNGHYYLLVNSNTAVFAEDD